MSNDNPLAVSANLRDLKAIGVDDLSDIPMVHVLEFVRKVCLDVSKDDPESPMGKAYGNAVVHVQAAIDALNVSGCSFCGREDGDPIVPFECPQCSPVTDRRARGTFVNGSR